MARRIDASALPLRRGVRAATRAQLIGLLIRIEHQNIDLMALYECAYEDAYDLSKSDDSSVWDWLFARRFALVERARELKRMLARSDSDGSVWFSIDLRRDVEALLRENKEVDAGEAWLLRSAVAPQPGSEGAAPPGLQASGSSLR